MSRTYANHTKEFHIAYKDEIEELYNKKSNRWFNSDNDLKRAKWKYRIRHRDPMDFGYRFPKGYRKIVNSSRRNHDNRELFKETHFEDYDGIYDRWNCKSSDPMWFW